ncbi:hypothetical protein Tco_0964870, partial [Tanacetum coccineum]
RECWVVHFFDHLSDSEPAAISPVIRADIPEIPTILPVALEAEVAVVASPAGHELVAPAFSPFLSSDQSELDSKSELTKDAYESFASERPLSPDSYEAVVTRWKSKVATRSSSLSGSSSISSTPIPSTKIAAILFVLPTTPVETTVAPHSMHTSPIRDIPAIGTTPTHRLTDGCNRVTTRKRFRHPLPIIQPSSHPSRSSSDSSSSSESSSTADTSGSSSKSSSRSSFDPVVFRGPSIASHYEASIEDSMEADAEAGSEADVGVDIEADIDADLEKNIDTDIMADIEADIAAEAAIEEAVQSMYEHLTEIPTQRLDDIEEEQRAQETRAVTVDTQRANLIELVRVLKASHLRLRDSVRVEGELC